MAIAVVSLCSTAAQSRVPLAARPAVHVQVFARSLS
jgi:hypothetical protein